LWNSSARVEKNDGKDPEVKDEWITTGNVTEQGLLKYFMYDFGGQGVVSMKNKLDDSNLL
jgi:hypothetical protein